MVTWCSGSGRAGPNGGSTSPASLAASMSSATLWVHLDSESLRPAPMSAAFDEIFAPSTLGRTVSSRLTLGPPPPDLELAPWSLRFTDFDVMNHVNNAVAFVIVEEALARQPPSARAAARRSRIPIVDRPRHRPRASAACRAGDCYDGWVVDDQGTAASPSASTACLPGAGPVAPRSPRESSVTSMPPGRARRSRSLVNRP